MAVTPVEQVQQQLTEAVEVLRARIEDALEQARVRAEEAAGFAVKLGYAYVGAFVVAQERMSLRVSELVNRR